MTAEVGFVGALLLTLALLGFVVATGLRARRRWHIGGVIAVVLALGTTIVLAVRMGQHYDLPSAGPITPLHLFLAKLTTLAYLAPGLTGWLTTRDASWRPWHRRCAFTVLGLTVCTAITGTWMLLAAQRLGTSTP